MSSAKKISICAKPSAFFQERVTEVMSKHHIETSKEAEFYLVDLLARFMVAAENGAGEPLALKYLKAQSADVDSGERFRLFRSVGDTSLYVSGFFRDSISRKVVDLDYYREIGTGAYRHILQVVKDGTFQHLYNEMVEKFSMFADVLTEISHETFVQNNQDLLRLYEVYIKTGSELARKQLSEKGMPIAAPDTSDKLKKN